MEYRVNTEAIKEVAGHVFSPSHLSSLVSGCSFAADSLETMAIVDTTDAT